MTPSTNHHYQDWDLFVLGVLDSDEEREMASHLAFGCEICTPTYLSAQATVSALATLSPQVGITPESEVLLKRRLSGNGVSANPHVILPKEDLPRHTAASWIVAAAALLIAATLGISRASLEKNLQRNSEENIQLQNQLEQLKTQLKHFEMIDETLRTETLASLQRQLSTADAEKESDERQLKALQIKLKQVQQLQEAANESAHRFEMSSENAKTSLAEAQVQINSLQAQIKKLSLRSEESDRITVLLDSTPLSHLDLKPVDGVQASARVYWENDRGLLLVARNLPTLPRNSSFHLWFYRQGSPDLLYAGAVPVSINGDAFVFVPPGPALLSMAGAVLTRQSDSSGQLSPGEAILRIKP